MPKIIINETDATKSYEAVEVQNAVYVPGFSSAFINPDCADDSYIPSATGGLETGMPSRIPTLCMDVTTFQTYFGSSAPTFNENQNYPIYKTGPVNQRGFDPKAIFNEQMFLAGDADPGYCYALELLRAGIPVIYERMNKFSVVEQTIKKEEDEGEASNLYWEEVDSAPTELTAADPGKMVFHRVSSNEPGSVYICVAANGEKYDWRLFETNVDNADAYFSFDISVPSMYEKLYERFVSGTDENGPSIIRDRNLYDIKFLTSGGYPVYEYNLEGGEDTNKNVIANGMCLICEERGDAIALIDHTNNKYRRLTGTNSVFESLNLASSKYRISSAYAAMFTPWVQYSGLYSGAYPGSFAYLVTLAESVNNNPSWLAVAGVQRGVVPSIVSLETNQKITESIANSLIPASGSSINPIARINPYGLTIWGNRTLLNNQGYDKASSFLNLRNLSTEVKKKVYAACKSLMFEQNSDILWINFKAKIVPLLDEMCTSAGISDYKIERVSTTKNTKVIAKITLYPIYAVEEFEISVILTDSDETIVSEEE